jgi:polygalacturonase
MFDVTDFGAMGDGITDDTAAVQTAINAAMETGGGTVYFPDGDYRLGLAEED